MENRDKNNDKYMVYEVTNKMCKNVSPDIQVGDHVLISFLECDAPDEGDFVLISDGLNQWLDEYSPELREKHNNIYKVMKFFY